MSKFFIFLGLLVFPIFTKAQTCQQYPFPHEIRTDQAILCLPGIVHIYVYHPEEIIDNYTYQWTDGNGIVLPTHGSSIIVQNVTSSITYNVIAINSQNCPSLSSSITIPFLSLSPTIDINNGLVCGNGSTTISVNNPQASYYTWQVNGDSNPLSDGTHFSSAAVSFDYYINATSLQISNVVTNLPSFGINVSAQISSACGSILASGLATIKVDPNPISLNIISPILKEESTIDLTPMASPTGGVWLGAGVNSNNLLDLSETEIGANALQYNFTNSDGCVFTANGTMNITSPPPTVSAGNNQALSLPLSSYTQTGTASSSYGTIVSQNWTQISGPSTATLTGASSLNLTLSDLIAGSYLFQLTATDDYGGSASSQVTIETAYTNNYNYVKEATVLVSGKVQSSDLVGLPVEQLNVNTTYIDGIGRNMQSVSWGSSPSKLDQVQPIVYDAFGREAIKYLPYAASQSNGNYVTTAINDQTNYYQSAPKTANDIQPYSQTVFEPSPLNRIIKQGAPGTIYQPDNNPNSTSDHTIKRHYEFNGSNDVILFTYDPATGFVSTGSNSQVQYYNANQLEANRTTDEHQNDAIEYVDKLGHTICKKVQYKTDTNGTKLYASTYYIYDDFGRLVVVLPPEAIKSTLSFLTKN